MQKFPVKFPVCREFVRRPVRSALHRQPGSPEIREFCLGIAEKPANSGLLRIRFRSPHSRFTVLGGQTPESLRLNSRIFPFSGDRGWRLGAIATARGGGSAANPSHLRGCRLHRISSKYEDAGEAAAKKFMQRDAKAPACAIFDAIRGSSY